MPASQLRPRSAPEIVDASVQLLRQHARPLLVLGAVLVIPTLVFGLVRALAFAADPFTILTSPTTPGRPNAVIAPQLPPGFWEFAVPFVIVWSCWFLIVFGAIVASASAAYREGQALEPAEALRVARVRAGTLLGSGLLTSLLVLVQFVGVIVLLSVVAGIVVGGVMAAGGSVAGSRRGGLAAVATVGLVLTVLFLAAFLVVGAWLFGRYVTVSAVGVNERLGVRETMRRARELSRGSLGRITALLLILGVVFAALSLGAVGVLMLLLRSAVAANVLMAVVNVPLYALVGALIAVLYHDLRIRHEGLDVELLAEELAPAPTDVHPA